MSVQHEITMADAMFPNPRVLAVIHRALSSSVNLMSLSTFFYIQQNLSHILSDTALPPFHAQTPIFGKMKC